MRIGGTDIHRIGAGDALLSAGEAFVHRIVRVFGVERLALVGSLATPKPQPKDIDFLLTVTNRIEMAAAATATRKLKGALQGDGSGADVFLCDTNGQYLGRICSYREWHYRAACEGTSCRPGA